MNNDFIPPVAAASAQPNCGPAIAGRRVSPDQVHAHALGVALDEPIPEPIQENPIAAQIRRDIEIWKLIAAEKAVDGDGWMEAYGREAELARHWRGRWYVAQEQVDRWRAAFWLAALAAVICAVFSLWAVAQW